MNHRLSKRPRPPSIDRNTFRQVTFRSINDLARCDCLTADQAHTTIIFKHARTSRSRNHATRNPRRRRWPKSPKPNGLPVRRNRSPSRQELTHLNRRVAGKKIVSADRLGKRVVLRLDSADRLIFEPRMTGLVLISEPPTREHLRFRLGWPNARSRVSGFGTAEDLGNVTLFSEQQYQTKLTDGTLGPDALEIQPDDLAGRFRGSRREIKVALLDQSAIAGIGNLYASEILHLAEVDPRARCDRLSRKQWQRIHQWMQQSVVDCDRIRRIHSIRRHLPKCFEPIRQLSKRTPGLRSRGRTLQLLQVDQDQTHRPGATVNFLLSEVSTEKVERLKLCWQQGTIGMPSSCKSLGNRSD